MLLGNVFQQFYNMVDSFVVGRFIGTSALAAVGTSFPVLFLMLSLIMGVAMGSTVLISQHFGRKDFASLQKVIDSSYIFIFAAGVSITIAGIVASPFILKILAVPPAILPEANAYLKIIFAGMLAMFGYNGVAAMLRGLGDSKTPLYLLMASTVINIILDLYFVIVLRWGVQGAAWATVIAQAISFTGAIIILNAKNKYLKIDFRRLRWDKPSFSLMLKIGLPTGIQQTLVSLGMMVLSRIVNEFGPVTMAAYTAAVRIDSIASLPAMNLSQAITAFTGQNIGAGKVDRVKRGHLSALAINTGISLIITFAVLFFGRNLMSIFTADTAVIEVGAKYLLIVGIFYAAFGVMLINNGVMRGAGDVMIPLIISIIALWFVRVPAALLFTKVFSMGANGIWWSIPAGWLIGAICSTWYYYLGRWKRKDIMKPRPEIRQYHH
jgi:putative MATE family efflux protein